MFRVNYLILGRMIKDTDYKTMVVTLFHFQDN